MEPISHPSSMYPSSYITICLSFILLPLQVGTAISKTEEKLTQARNRINNKEVCDRIQSWVEANYKATENEEEVLYLSIYLSINEIYPPIFYDYLSCIMIIIIIMITIIGGTKESHLRIQSETRK